MCAAHTKTDKQTTNRNTEADPDSYSPSVSHCISRLSVLPPSRPPLPPILRGYQAGAEGLSPADSRSSGGWGGGVLRGETWVGGGGGGGGGVNVCVWVWEQQLRD